MYLRVLQRIRILVKQGRYVLSIHAENEMADDEFAEQDIEAAILNGNIVQREKDRIGRAKYVIEGRAIDGRSMSIVVQLLETRPAVVIVTVYET